MEPITLIALGTAAVLFLRKGKKPSKKPASGPVVGPVKPGQVVLNATLGTVDGVKSILFAPSKDARVKIDGNEAAITTEKVPVDVLVSVPEAFDPLLVDSMSNARVLMGTPGTTRDLLFRVSAWQPRTSDATSVRLHVEAKESDGSITTGPLWLSVHAPESRKGIETALYQGDQNLWYFTGRIDGALVKQDGPFASEEAAKVAADNWAAAQAK